MLHQLLNYKKETARKSTRQTGNLFAKLLFIRHQSPQEISTGERERERDSGKAAKTISE